jgi:hypothetical protein
MTHGKVLVEGKVWTSYPTSQNSQNNMRLTTWCFYFACFLCKLYTRGGMVNPKPLIDNVS